MKHLICAIFIFISTSAIAQDQTTTTSETAAISSDVKKKKWTKIRDVIKTTIEKSKRSQKLNFQAPAFSVNRSLDTNSSKVSGAPF